MKKSLVYLDLSGSTPYDFIAEALALAQRIGADFSTFDTHLCLRPTQAKVLTMDQLMRPTEDFLEASTRSGYIGGGGTNLDAALGDLYDDHQPEYLEYDCIYVLSDLYSWLDPLSRKFLQVTKVVFLTKSSDASLTDAERAVEFMNTVTAPELKAYLNVHAYSMFLKELDNKDKKRGF
jgi:hypothetical protein